MQQKAKNNSQHVVHRSKLNSTNAQQKHTATTNGFQQSLEGFETFRQSVLLIERSFGPRKLCNNNLSVKEIQQRYPPSSLWDASFHFTALFLPILFFSGGNRT